jgi:dipeptidyl aminopeptidase/acylaminoacyl peptidase
MRTCRIWGLALAGAAVLFALPALARPLEVADLLRMEGLGRTAVSARSGALVLEHRIAYAEGSRFDYGEHSNLFRTRLEVVDTRLPGPPVPLFPHERDVGYALGPLSPDGAKAAVYRLKADRWELGIADVAARTVSWTGVTPEISGIGRTVAWADARRLAVIALPEGLTPFALRIAHPAAAITRRWGAAARGGAAVTVLGSGSRAALNPRDPPSTLVLLDVETGAARPLAKGRFKDLELSATGRWAALSEAAEDIPLEAGKPIRGDYGTAKRRRRLVLVALASGRTLRIRPDCDISRHLLAWSSRADELLVFARQDGAAWTAGRLLKVSADRGESADVSGGRIDVAAGGPSEIVGAGWADGRPVAFGRRIGSPSPRADWWDLGGRTPRPITAALSAPRRTGAVAAGDLLLVADADVTVEISGTGKVLRRFPGVLDSGPSVSDAPPPRFTEAFLGDHGLNLLWRQHGRAALLRFDADGARTMTPAPPGAELIVADGSGGAMIRLSGPGGADRLLWLERSGRTVPLFVVNDHLADVALPEVRAVRHAGPGGEPLVSWLVLPPQRKSDRPPPLVVWPYLNLTYPRPPASLEPRGLPFGASVQLLAGHGYAVLLPSLPVPRDNAAPAEGVAKALLAIVDAAAHQPGLERAFDPGRLGLWGHSFGGYSIAAIVGQTDRFAAGVTWAAAGPNLFAKWGDFGLPRRVWPEDGLANPSWTEDLQGDTRGPPWATPQRYLAGSPLLGLGQARTPLLIAHGDQDGFPIAGSEQLFSAYYRRNAEAEMVTYWGEGHVLRSPANLQDFYTRGLTWLDEHLRFTPPALAGPTP